MKLEGRMHKDTVTRIADGLRASRDGKLRWLQQGNGVLNPLVVEAQAANSTSSSSNQHEKGDNSGNGTTTTQASDSSSVTRHVEPSSSSSSSSSSSASRAQETVSFASHSLKTDSCLSFLSEGFEELLKCRDVSLAMSCFHN